MEPYISNVIQIPSEINGLIRYWSHLDQCD